MTGPGGPVEYCAGGPADPPNPGDEYSAADLPDRLHAARGRPSADVDVDDIVADLAENHVAAPSAVEAKLAPVVEQARNEGIDLEVVVIAENGRHDSQLRDLATAVGQQTHGGTILVLSPDWAGTYSDTLSRVVLEAGEDRAKFTGNPVVSTENFVHEIQTPQLPWTAITCVLLVGTAAVVGATYYAKERRVRPGSGLRNGPQPV